LPRQFTLSEGWTVSGMVESSSAMVREAPSSVDVRTEAVRRLPSYADEFSVRKAACSPAHKLHEQGTFHAQSSEKAEVSWACQSAGLVHGSRFFSAPPHIESGLECYSYSSNWDE
jgi:hypothetical protein